MRIWLDDIRVPPENEGWLWLTTSKDALALLDAALESQRYAPVGEATFEAIAFDHDLGGDDDSRRVLTWIVEHNFWPDHIYFLTSNPIGRKWLVGTARRYAPDSVKIHSM